MSRRWLVSSLLLFTQGCSFIFVSGPPDGHEQLRYFDCVSNGAAPAADASWAVLDGLVAVSAASQDGDLDKDGKKMKTGGAAALFGVIAAVHAGSMIYGLIKTDRCGDAKLHLQQRIAEQDADTQDHVRQLEEQLRGTATPAPAPAPQVLELVPAPEAQPLPATDPGAATQPAPAPPPTPATVPPPPDAYTQPPPSQPAPAAR